MSCKGKALCIPYTLNGIDEGDFLCQHISIYLAAQIDKQFLEYMYLWNVCFWQTHKCIRNFGDNLGSNEKFQPDIGNKDVLHL